jgi:dienelactone hydrolase
MIAITLCAVRPVHADHAARGTLLRSVPLGHLGLTDIRQRLHDAGFDTSTVRLEIDLYRLEYSTIDPDGRPIMASGLLAVPADHARASLVVSFTHGTELARLGAPSTSVDSEDGFVIAPAMTYASAGFVASAPDYLGMGTGPGPHPFMDVPSETSATLDMLRAARQFGEQHQRRLARRVLITGFSQGAFPAIGLARALGDGSDAWFRVGAVAPISAPYHWSQWVREAVNSTSTVAAKTATVYLAYFTVAWNRLHQLYAAPSDWYQPTYAVDIEEMMDGDHTPLEIVGFLADRPKQLFTSTAVDALTHPTGRLAAALDVVDRTCDLAAAAPVRLYAASGDPDVAIDHSRQCRARLARSGSQVELFDVGDVDHTGSVARATPEVLAWFTALRDRRACSVDD